MTGNLVQRPPAATAALAAWHQHAQAALPAHAGAQALLADLGCTDPAVQAAWRLGAPDLSCLNGIDAEGEAALLALGIPTSGPGWKNTLRGGGIVVPTVLPEDPSRIVGLARLTPAQRKHGMLTQPAAGLGGPVSAFAASAPVLAVGVPLALHLASLGCADVLLVEQPDFLAGLLPFFTGRHLRLVATRPVELAALRAAVQGHDGQVSACIASTNVGGITADVGERLGLDLSKLPDPEPTPTRTPILLRDLVVFAQARLAEGQAHAALEAAGLDQTELIATYGIGYLPADYQNALDRTSRRAFSGTRLGGSLLLPATDAQGQIVDGLVVYRGTARQDRPLAVVPAGLLGGALVTAHTDLLLTDTVCWLARLWRAGYRNVLLVRGPDDVARNVARLVQAGVQGITLHIRQDEAQIAELLRAAGISVGVGAAITDAGPAAVIAATMVPTADEDTVPVVIVEDDDPLMAESPPVEAPAATVIPFPQPAVESVQPPAAPVAPSLPAVHLVDHDPSQGLATFSAGPVTYTVQIPWDASTRCPVTLRAANKVFRDTFDLAVDAQRRRFAANAGMTVGIATGIIAPQLAALDLAMAALRRPTAASLPAGVALAPAERAAAEAAVRDPALLDHIIADLTTLGSVGEDAQKRALLLAALSRKLDEPVWAAYVGSSGVAGGGLLDAIAAITPPEELLAVSRLSGAALYYAEPESLRHRLLLLPDAGAISDEVAVALRVLHTRGALSAAQVARSPTGGRSGTSVVQVRGPVSVLVGAANTDHPLAESCLAVTADDSAAHTAALLAAERQRHADLRQRQPATRAAICQRLHAMQRLLACRPVVIPFAGRILFPARSVQHRREHAAFLGLIAASALLHQFQRLSDGPAIIADVRDFAVAQGIAEALGLGGDRECSRAAAQLLRAWWASGTATATMADLHALLPDWTRHTFRAVLPELLALDYVASAPGGRGKARVYHLLAAASISPAAAVEPRIRLLPTSTMGLNVDDAELARLAAVGETITTNLYGDTAMG